MLGIALSVWTVSAAETPRKAADAPAARKVDPKPEVSLELLEFLGGEDNAPPEPVTPGRPAPAANGRTTSHSAPAGVTP